MAAAYWPAEWPATARGFSATQRPPHARGDAPGGEARRENRGLGVDGQVELVGRALEHEPGQGRPSALSARSKIVFAVGEAAAEARAHPDVLGPLAGNTKAWAPAVTSDVDIVSRCFPLDSCVSLDYGRV